MEDYFKSNKELWNELTSIHQRSEFYGVEAFKAGKSSLESIELTEMGDVSGKSLLHLQCHFGLDTLSRARLGASVTGADFSEKSIELARSLARELGITASFICCNIYDLPENLNDKFDIVFTSYGALVWLPDLKKWAEIIVHYLKRGGVFYIVEGHPFMSVFDNSRGVDELRVANSYFHRPEPVRWEPEGDYTDRNTVVVNPSYEWTHSLSDIINALISVGLKIDYLHEFPVASFKCYPFAEPGDNGMWRIKGDKLPLVFSIRATNP